MLNLNGMWGASQFKFHGKYMGMSTGEVAPPANFYYAPAEYYDTNITKGDEYANVEMEWDWTEHAGKRVELTPYTGYKCGLYVFSHEFKYTPKKNSHKRYWITPDNLVFHDPSFKLTVNIQIAGDLKAYLIRTQDEHEGEYEWFNMATLVNSDFGVEGGVGYFYDYQGNEAFASSYYWEITDIELFKRLGFSLYTPEQLGRPSSLNVTQGYPLGRVNISYFERKRMIMGWLFYNIYNSRYQGAYRDGIWHLNFINLWDNNMIYPDAGYSETNAIYNVDGFKPFLTSYNGTGYVGSQDYFRQNPLCCVHLGVKQI